MTARSFAQLFPFLMIPGTKPHPCRYLMRVDGLGIKGGWNNVSANRVDNKLSGALQTDFVAYAAVKTHPDNKRAPAVAGDWSINGTGSYALP